MKIGNPHTKPNLFYKEMLRRFGGDDHLPTLIYEAYRAVYDVSDKHPDDIIRWTGSVFERALWPDEGAVWTADYERFASKVAEQQTIIDIGSGLSVLSTFLHKQFPSARYINIEIDPDGARFGELLCGQNKIAAKHVHMDLKSSLHNPEEMEQLRDIMGDGEKIVVTRSGLHPIYTDEEYRLLFDFLLSCGVTSGYHTELTGFRTKTYDAMHAVYNRKLLGVGKHYLECEADPFSYIASRNDMVVTDREEIWPFYLWLRMPTLSHWPSYLAWESVDKG